MNKSQCVHFSESVFNQFVDLRKEVLGILNESGDEFWDLNLETLRRKISLVEDHSAREMLDLRFQSAMNQAKLPSTESSRFSEYATVG
jgi:hypothetical protein